jgi:Protein of unknown function (DUF3800)
LHVAIDETYGPRGYGRSRYVTGERRTQVGVVFDDDKVEYIREQIIECLSALREFSGGKHKEFHFVDIYNRNGIWGCVPTGINLRIFEFFAHIYESYRWPVLIQTVDKRTFRDMDGLNKKMSFDGLDPCDPSDVALSLLCLKIRMRFRSSNEPLTLILDEGRRKVGQPFGDELFRGWPASFVGRFASSEQEGLLQIADFVAFCINRSTHLSLKEKRTDLDLWFMELVGQMRLNCDDIVPLLVTADFTVEQFDEFHRLHREFNSTTN